MLVTVVVPERAGVEALPNGKVSAGTPTVTVAAAGAVNVSVCKLPAAPLTLDGTLTDPGAGGGVTDGGVTDGGVVLPLPLIPKVVRRISLS